MVGVQVSKAGLSRGGWCSKGSRVVSLGCQSNEDLLWTTRFVDA